MRSIIVAFTDHPAAQKIRSILISSGFSVAGVCTSGAQVLSLARRVQGGGLIICSSRFHDMTTSFLAEQLVPEFDFLLLLHANDNIMDADQGIYLLHLPLRKPDLIDSVRMLLTTRQMKLTASETPVEAKPAKTGEKNGRSPEEKKLIEDAKSILMNRNNLTEEQAHRFLQKRSMDSGSKLTDTARAILEGW